MYYNHKGKLCKHTFTENSSNESKNFLKRYFVHLVGKEQRWNADRSMGTDRLLNKNYTVFGNRPILARHQQKEQAGGV